MPSKNLRTVKPATRLEVVLYLWEFENAPPHLQRVVSPAHAGGWLAFIRPGSPELLVQALLQRWHLPEHRVRRYEAEDGGIILAGPHLLTGV